MDEWTATDAHLDAAALRARARRELDERGPLIVEHRFYRRASAPHRFVCADADELDAYLDREVAAGDAIWIWAVLDVCRDDNAALHAKKPDAAGRVPVGGAY